MARRRGACDEECEPNPKPRPKPNPSSADVAEGGVASIGVRSGTREEPGTLTQGAPVFPGSSRLGNEPKTPGWLVQDPTTRPIGDLHRMLRKLRALHACQVPMYEEEDTCMSYEEEDTLRKLCAFHAHQVPLRILVPYIIM